MPPTNDTTKPEIARLKDHLTSNPTDSEALHKLGKVYALNTQTELAIDCYERALSTRSNDTQLLCDLADAELRGKNYLSKLANIQKTIRPTVYVEVGVCRGHSFILASPETRAIGIDPEPQLGDIELPERHKVVQATSDDYLTSELFNTDLCGKPIDLAFIDGMHLFEYALRDFINLEKHCHEHSVILIHDVYPITELTAQRKRESDFWSGDIWKLMICLKEQRPDLECFTLPCPPTGLGVVRNLNPNDKRLQNNLDTIIEKYKQLPFSRIEHERAVKLNLVTPEHQWP